MKKRVTKTIQRVSCAAYWHTAFRKTVNTIAILLLMSGTVYAQSPTMHYEGITNRAQDYMSIGGNYLLLGEYHPLFISGMNNTSPLGFVNRRLHLQIVDPASLNTISSYTFCTAAELNNYQFCQTLSVSFTALDIKQTSDGGFIICGDVRSDQETGNCNYPPFNAPFLLKVNSSGGVQWFKRYYEADYALDMVFKSVVEIDGGNGYVICGSVTDCKIGPDTIQGPRALAIGTDASGVVQWEHLMEVPLYSDTTFNPALYTNTEYNEVTTFRYGPFVYYVAVGSSITYQPDEGGVIVTTFDATGSIVGNGVITSYDHRVAIDARGVVDATDANVLITGYALPYASTEWCPHVMKVDPLSLQAPNIPPYMTYPPPAFPPATVSFSNLYPNPGNYVLPNSITTYEGSNAIYVTGDDRSDGAFLLHLDGSGNLVKYDRNNIGNARRGYGVNYDPANGYPFYSGHCGVLAVNDDPEFLTTDKYSNNTCATQPAIFPKQLQWDQNYITPLTPNILEINDAASGFNVVTTDMLSCGSPQKPGRSTGITNEMAEAKDQLVISPNPATSSVELTVPESLSNSRLTVVDMTGRILLTKELKGQAGVQNIDISVLAAGTYILSAENSTTSQQVHFVKK